MGTLVKPGACKHCSWMGVAGEEAWSLHSDHRVHGYHWRTDDYRGHRTAAGDIWPRGYMTATCWELHPIFC